MRRNVGTLDRTVRALAALGFGVCAVLAPFPLLVRVGVFGLSAVYFTFSALAGTCFGYRMLGKTTCPLETPR